MSLTMSADQLVHLVIDEIWNHGELEMADALFTDEYVNHGGLIPDLLRGPEAVKLSAILYRCAFPTFHIEVDEVTSEREAIVLRWVAHSRPPLANDPVPREGGLRGITRCRLQTGKIAESWTVWDSRAALVRLGATKVKSHSDRSDDAEGRGLRTRSAKSKEAQRYGG